MSLRVVIVGLLAAGASFAALTTCWGGGLHGGGGCDGVCAVGSVAALPNLIAFIFVAAGFELILGHVPAWAGVASGIIGAGLVGLAAAVLAHAVSGWRRRSQR